jgi:predicted alpha/beta-hydrolase family hydrolase
MTVRDVDTPLGLARAHTAGADGAVEGTLVLGHGAGGGVESADLVAVTAAAVADGWRVVRVEQPWRVAGKRIAPAPPRLDEAWRAVLDALRENGVLAGRLVLGGRSAGARVACRTAAGLGAAGVLALAFPLHPPGRPQKSRAPELTAVTVPLVVVQGETDASLATTRSSATSTSSPRPPSRGSPTSCDVTVPPVAVEIRTVAGHPHRSAGARAPGRAGCRCPVGG